jgi:hypothetical protein
MTRDFQREQIAEEFVKEQARQVQRDQALGALTHPEWTTPRARRGPVWATGGV